MVTQAFLDRRPRQAWLIAQQLGLHRMSREHQNAVAQRRRGRAHRSTDDVHDQRADIRVGWARTALALPQEPRDDVVAGRALAPIDKLVDVIGKGGYRGLNPPAELGRYIVAESFFRAGQKPFDLN